LLHSSLSYILSIFSFLILLLVFRATSILPLPILLNVSPPTKLSQPDPAFIPMRQLCFKPLPLTVLSRARPPGVGSRGCLTLHPLDPLSPSPRRLPRLRPHGSRTNGQARELRLDLLLVGLAVVRDGAVPVLRPGESCGRLLRRPFVTSAVRPRSPQMIG
jgi:hypothetical protein